MKPLLNNQPPIMPKSLRKKTPQGFVARIVDGIYRFFRFIAQMLCWMGLSWLSTQALTWVALLLPITDLMRSFLTHYRFWNEGIQIGIGALLGLKDWWGKDTRQALLPLRMARSFKEVFALWFISSMLLTVLNMLYALTLHAVYLVDLPLSSFIIPGIAVASLVTLGYMIIKRWIHKQATPPQQGHWLWHKLLTTTIMTGLGLLASLGFCVCHTLFLPAEMLFPLTFLGLSPLTSLTCIVTCFFTLLGLVANPIATPNKFDIEQMTTDIITILVTASLLTLNYSIMGAIIHYTLIMRSNFIPTVVAELFAYSFALGATTIGPLRVIADPKREEVIMNAKGMAAHTRAAIIASSK